MVKKHKTSKRHTYSARDSRTTDGEPSPPSTHRTLLGSLEGTVTTVGDIVSPLDEPWRALTGRVIGARR